MVMKSLLKIFSVREKNLLKLKIYKEKNTITLLKTYLEKLGLKPSKYRQKICKLTLLYFKQTVEFKNISVKFYGFRIRTSQLAFLHFFK